MDTEKKIVIVSACRTPFDKFGGLMKEIPSYLLGKEMLEKVLEKVNVPKEDVEYIFYGTTQHTELARIANVPVRQALLKAGFPPETMSVTIDRACCASMTALMWACREIQAGEIEVAIAAGAENLSNIPHIVEGLRWGKRMGSIEMYDVAAGFIYPDFGPVAGDADKVAKEYGITREMMDEWSVRSHKLYKKAFDEGKFKDEVVPYTVYDKKGNPTVIEADVAPRPDTSMEGLSKLKPVYGTEAITAGNAPGLNAGASAVLVMTEEKAKEYGLEPICYLKDWAGACSEAKNIPTVPALVTQKLLKRNNMKLEDLDLLEINEAFAAMPLVSTKILADGDEKMLEHLREITNVNGGAVAIGHPMGATGLRLIMTLAYELKRRGGGEGIACLCGGLAQGDGFLIEV